MKIARYIPFIVFGGIGFLLTAFVVASQFEHPEKEILGEWKEVAWKYERVDKHNSNATTLVEMDEEVKEELSAGLVIHTAEKWKFDNTKLTLYKKGKAPVELHWKLKGRGHILKLTYDGDHKEYYQIKKISDKKLVLYFENEMHARGIVKIVFTR